MEATETNSQDLPVEVRDYLVSFLDYRSRRTCRLVCHVLKESVDVVGVSIKIESGSRGSIELCKNVNATEVQIQLMFRLWPERVDLNYKKWRTVIISGLIDSSWLNTSLQRKCPNLRVLILDGNSLISQDFSGSLDLPVFEHLTQLRFNNYQISSDCLSFPRQDQRILFRRLNGNMLYLLGSIRSRVLRVLDLFVTGSLSTDYTNPHVSHWQNKTLFDFIENHRNSLKELNTTNLGVLPSPEHPWFQFSEDKEVYQIPLKLKQFCWHVQKSTNAMLSSFWKDLLLSQQSLEKLSLKCADTLLSPMKTVLFPSNTRTLNVIILELRNTPVLDMSLFSSLEVLQKVTISGHMPKPTSLINLNQLPRTRLTSLNLIYVNIKDDFDGIEFMDGFRPEALKLTGVPTSGLFSSCNYMKKFANLVLRCRNLNILYLVFRPSRSSVLRMDLNIKSLTTIQEKAGLNLWLSNLSDEGPRNHFCRRLDIRDIHDLTEYELEKKEAFRSQDGMQYMEQSGGANIDYLELISKKSTEFYRQEQPFNFTRNAESYTIWNNTQSNPHHFRILPNFQSYTMRVNDIGRVRISLDFYFDKSYEASNFRPAGC